MNQNPESRFDVLRHIERTSDQLNRAMEKETRSAFLRYPFTFTFLVLAGVTAVTEGLKDVITHINFFNGHPVRLLIAGVLVLLMTGTLYKRLSV